MDWFRWHHGSVTDPKFQVAARHSGATVAEVLAVWACLLEAASSNQEERGNTGYVDWEAIDCLLQMPDGRTAAICQALDSRNLIDFQTGHIGAWERRQPKRERDDNSTERSRAFREKQRQQKTGNTTESSATPRNANATPETPRGEERRVEKELPSSLRSDSSPADAEDIKPDRQKVSAEERAARLSQVTKDAIEAYNTALAKPAGALPAVRLATDQRRNEVKRCLKVAQAISREATGDPRITPEFWVDYFATVARDPFWSGQVPGGPGHENWTPDFESLTRPDTMAKIFERSVADQPLETTQ